MIEMLPRTCWVFQGKSEWCKSTVTNLLSMNSELDIVWVSPDPHSRFTALLPKQAHKLLGQEVDVVVFDAREVCDPDALGAVAGSIRGGGALILLLSEEEHLLLWQRRFEAVLARGSMCFQEGDVIPELGIMPEANISKPARYRTKDQQTAVTAIEKVALGHRKRPLVMTSDRGRGKSAALGIAAAHLLRAGKKRIVVTGPSLASVATIFKHTAELLPSATATRGRIVWEGARLEFIAPDALLAEKKAIDLLLVDEAAAIPTPMLADYIKRFSRVVFSTTLHGYEGSGRGFAIRFQKLLAEQCPNYKEYHLNTPIRWLPGDPLEKLIFDALLLDAKAAEIGTAREINAEVCQISRVDRKALAEDEVMLRSLFGLMITAHYRTRPSDLKIILSHPAISVWVMRYQGKVVAGAWSMDEGVLSPDLAIDIHAGKRRIKGHLLPQTLVNHAGNLTAATLRYQRVMRIAVHPELQGRGLGSALLQAMEKAGQKQGIDMMGASFGADLPLVNYWAQAGYTPIRLGVKQSDSSGYRSIVMLRSFSLKADEVLKQAHARFGQQWPYLLGSLFQQLPTELVLAITTQNNMGEKTLSQYDQQDVSAFAFAQRDFESSRYALSQWILAVIPNMAQLSAQQTQVLVMAILQGQTWPIMAQALKMRGKSDVLALLRSAVCILLKKT